MGKSDRPPPPRKPPPPPRRETMEVQMQWLDDTSEPSPNAEAPPSTRRGPPRLPGLPAIPPMPVAASEVPVPTNKTIEVEPHWLELVEERRAKNAQSAKVVTAPTDASRARPRIRPIIPREDE